MKRRTLVSDQRPFIRIIRNSNHFDMTNRHKNNNSLFSNCNIFSCKTHNKRLAHTITVTVCKASSATMRNSIFECQNTNKQTTMYTATTFIGRLPSVRLVSITFSKAQTTITISKIYYKHRNLLKYGKLRARVCFLYI